jgi:Protein of unknown function (DUF4232)
MRAWRWRLTAAATLLGPAALVAGCGSAASPSASPKPTVTVTATVTAPASSPAAAPTPRLTTPAGPAACATTALRPSLGPGGGAAGSTYYPIRLTNISGSACSLYGYPGVSFVTAAGGSQTGAPAAENPAFPRTLVTLAPGASAHAELQVVNAQNYPASACHPVAAHELSVYPPGQTSALFIGFDATACALPSVRILSVETVQPGPGGQ